MPLAYPSSDCFHAARWAACVGGGLRRRRRRRPARRRAAAASAAACAAAASATRLASALCRTVVVRVGDGGHGLAQLGGRRVLLAGGRRDRAARVPARASARTRAGRGRSGLGGRRVAAGRRLAGAAASAGVAASAVSARLGRAGGRGVPGRGVGSSPRSPRPAARRGGRWRPPARRAAAASMATCAPSACTVCATSIASVATSTAPARARSTWRGAGDERGGDERAPTVTGVGRHGDHGAHAQRRASRRRAPCARRAGWAAARAGAGRAAACRPLAGPTSGGNLVTHA